MLVNTTCWLTSTGLPKTVMLLEESSWQQIVNLGLFFEVSGAVMRLTTDEELASFTDC